MIGIAVRCGARKEFGADHRVRARLVEDNDLLSHFCAQPGGDCPGRRVVTSAWSERHDDGDFLVWVILRVEGL
jgi:hypothetical protein